MVLLVLDVLKHFFFLMSNFLGSSLQLLQLMSGLGKEFHSVVPHHTVR